VVPSGGRTGLAAGAVATEGELVLNLSRLDFLGEVSQLCRTVRVGAGAVTQAVHQHAEKEGLIWPIDLASKGSCQIGGNLSTNAGGLRVVRYGMARKWVTGLQVVTASGQILELNAGLEKNNTGYDLLQLFVGSEGTLGVITQATLKLAPLPSEDGKSVYFFAVRDLSGLPFLFEKCRQAPFEILAFEFFSDRCLKAVGEKLGRHSRLKNQGPYYVLTEVSGLEDRDAWLETVLSNPLIVDSLEAHSSEERKAVWSLREGITESLALSGALRKHDLSLPLPSVAPFLEEVESLLQQGRYALNLYFFGHFGDGSPHVNLLNPPGVPFQEFNEACDRFEPHLFSVLQKYQGSISSEHGVGLLKKKWLPHSRSPAELAIFRGIKSALDPRGLLNPGKIF
jgi:FAD/FMN-containing dehydrogenase